MKDKIKFILYGSLLLNLVLLGNEFFNVFAMILRSSLPCSTNNETKYDHFEKKVAYKETSDANIINVSTSNVIYKCKGQIYIPDGRPFKESLNAEGFYNFPGCNIQELLTWQESLKVMIINRYIGIKNSSM